MNRAAVLAFAMVGAGACATPREPAPPVASPPHAKPVVISIVGTNDVHGRLGRLPLLAGYIEALRARRARDGGVLVVDAGDAFQGTLESHLDEGATLIAAYNQIGYHAMALGNHEFDFGPVGPRSLPAPGDDRFGALKARLEQARFPVLGANLVTRGGEPPDWPNFHRSTTVEIAGVKIGLIGVMTREASEVIKRPNFEGLETIPLTEVIESEARRLRQGGAAAVIVLAHAGGRCDRTDDPHDLSSCDPESEAFEVARALPRGTVDAMVTGHRSTAVAHWVAQTPIVQAPPGLDAFSRVDLLVDTASGRVVDTKLHPPQALCQDPSAPRCASGSYEGQRVEPARPIATLVEAAEQHARAARSERLGVRLKEALSATKRSECPLGNLFVDLMREAVPEADAAIANGGSLRADLPHGELTYGQLHAAMPFENQLATLELTGRDLERIIRTNLTEDHGILSISGFRAQASCRGDQLVIDLTRNSGEPIDDDDVLRVVTSDFLAMGGDGLLPAAGLGSVEATFDAQRTVREVLVDGLKRRRELDASKKALFDEQRPRLRVPGALPVRCGDGSGTRG